MAICCVVCGEWYPEDARDRLDICPGCLPNFAGAQPPLDAWGTARVALEAYVDSRVQLSPLQREAMARLHARWEAEATRRLDGEDS